MKKRMFAVLAASMGAALALVLFSPGSAQAVSSPLPPGWVTPDNEPSEANPAPDETLAAPGAADFAPPIGDPAGWELTFADEFGDAALNRSRWATNYGFDTECQVASPIPGKTPYCDRSNNDEKEWYIDDAHEVSGGTLKLIARVNDCSGDQLPDRNYAPYSCENFPYTSGMISTRRGFSQLYGYFEARLKLPAGQGFWPAFWLMPQLPPLSSPAEVYWPPEIDIMEFKGQEVRNTYMTLVYSAIYPVPGSALNDWAVGGYDQVVYRGADFTAGFHTFAVYWAPDVIIWYVDGVERMRRTGNLPPGQASFPDYRGDMHIILNLAVGGNFVNFLLPPASLLPASMEIDYVRVYQIKKDNQTFLPSAMR